MSKTLFNTNLDKQIELRTGEYLITTPNVYLIHNNQVYVFKTIKKP